MTAKDTATPIPILAPEESEDGPEVGSEVDDPDVGTEKVGKADVVLRLAEVAKRLLPVEIPPPVLLLAALLPPSSLDDSLVIAGVAELNGLEPMAVREATADPTADRIADHPLSRYIYQLSATDSK